MANEGADAPSVMEGTPPNRDSQATMKNYRDYPFSGWTFQNMGAPLNVVMVPRGGSINELNAPIKQELGRRIFKDKSGVEMTFEDLFRAHYARGVILIQGNNVLYEKYYDGFGPHKQHWLVAFQAGIALAIIPVDAEAHATK